MELEDFKETGKFIAVVGGAESSFRTSPGPYWGIGGVSVKPFSSSEALGGGSI